MQIRKIDFPGGKAAGRGKGVKKSDTGNKRQYATYTQRSRLILLGSSRKVSRSGDDLFQVQHPCLLRFHCSNSSLRDSAPLPATVWRKLSPNRKFGSLTGTRAAFPGCRGGWFRAASSWGGLASPRLPHRPRASRAVRALRLLLSQTVASWGTLQVRSSSSERTGAKRGML